MGKRILITTFGSFGDVNPYLALAVALRARGHSVTFATANYYREEIERAGIAFHLVRPEVTYERELVARIMDPRKGTDVLLREVLFPAVRDAYQDVAAAAGEADLIVTHPATYGAHIAAEQSGVPWISTMLAPIGFFSRYDIPVFAPMPWAKRLERIPGAATLLMRAARRVTRAWPEPVYRLRRELGMPVAASPIFEGQHSPRCVLCLFSKVLAQPQPDWPPQTRVAGFLFRDEEQPLDAELARFLESGPPPIVFTLGSSATAAAGRFYHESIAAARQLGRRAVLLTGQHPENRIAAPLPPGIIAVEHAPHEQVFPHAAAVVHQGGIGTLAQALRAGVPMLITPHSHDQPDNAWRARAIGVAEILYPHRYVARRAAALLDRLLHDGSVRDRAAEVGCAVAGEDGVATACDVIEAHAV